MWRAAAMAVPPDPPMSSPSVRVTRRAVANDSASEMATISSAMSGS